MADELHFCYNSTVDDVKSDGNGGQVPQIPNSENSKWRMNASLKTVILVYISISFLFAAATTDFLYVQCESKQIPPAVF